MKGTLSHARRGACGLVSSPRTAHTHTARGLHTPGGCVDRRIFLSQDFGYYIDRKQTTRWGKCRLISCCLSKVECSLCVGVLQNSLHLIFRSHKVILIRYHIHYHIFWLYWINTKCQTSFVWSETVFKSKVGVCCRCQCSMSLE